MDYYFDRTGKPIPMMEYISLFENKQYQIIQQNHFKNVWISTVWLGINHNFMMEYPPIIFETMIFSENWNSDLQWRYCTEEAAKRKHKTLLTIMQSEIPKKILSKKWNKRERTKLLSKLARI